MCIKSFFSYVSIFTLATTLTNLSFALEGGKSTASGRAAQPGKGTAVDVKAREESTSDALKLNGLGGRNGTAGNEDGTTRQGFDPARARASRKRVAPTPGAHVGPAMLQVSGESSPKVAATILSIKATLEARGIGVANVSGPDGFKFDGVASLIHGFARAIDPKMTLDQLNEDQLKLIQLLIESRAQELSINGAKEMPADTLLGIQEYFGAVGKAAKGPDGKPVDVAGKLYGIMKPILEKMDANHDGKVTDAERKAALDDANGLATQAGLLGSDGKPLVMTAETSLMNVALAAGLGGLVRDGHISKDDARNIYKECSL